MNLSLREYLMHIAKASSKISMPLKVRAKLASEPGLASYEDVVQGPSEPRMSKVSVTIDRGLLSLVDHYVQGHPGMNRSAIFDQALELWAKDVQKKADVACYSTESATSEKRARADWAAIQTEAARHIW